MTELVGVQRYDLEPVDSLGTAYTIGGEPSPTGEACMWDDVAPLLAELATLRERTRRRDAATDPPPVGVPVLALDRGGMYRWRTATYDIDATGGVYRDERTGFDARVVSWWPLPEVSDV